MATLRTYSSQDQNKFIRTRHVYCNGVQNLLKHTELYYYKRQTKNVSQRFVSVFETYRHLQFCNLSLCYGIFILDLQIHEQVPAIYSTGTAKPKEWKNKELVPISQTNVLKELKTN